MSTNPIIPYAFHPKKKQNAKPTVVINNFCELLGLELPETRVSVSYCRCKHCPDMPTVKESVCCIDVQEATSKWAKNWKKFVDETDKCYSSHHVFQKIINDELDLDHFIQIDRMHLKQIANLTRSVYVDEYIAAEKNDMYRFACYRKTTYLVHDIMGIGKRVQLPACIVGAIRNKYPSKSETYKGYEEFFGED
uniref:Uncharacterized protein n=1 Tax=Panagrolaimus superbus TaxID=310955 RepID=A0A914XWQ5_9BILA